MAGRLIPMRASSGPPHAPGTRARVRHVPAVDTTSSPAGLRAVASFEALKGVLAVLFAIALIAVVHKDIGDIADRLIDVLHIDPERRFAQAFLNAAYTVTPGRIWTLVGGAFAYAAVRWVEAYGLWNRRVWAEWFALLSGTLYLPFEAFEIYKRSNWLHWTVFLVNIVIVIYMAKIRLDERRRKCAAEPTVESLKS